METIQIHITAKDISYPIYFGSKLITNLETLLSFNNYSKIFIISDTHLESTLLKTVRANITHDAKFFILPAGEKEKTIENIQRIWKAMHAAKLDRKSLVINLGGGVITDMGGFAASTYMRGMDFVNIPTTLLSQVDASVGGKTGINFTGIKNLIGTFTQPKAVVIDVTTLETLPQREFISGFAEIIKHGLIKDTSYFQKVTSKAPGDFSQEELIAIIKRSCEIKASVVHQDETENGQRKLLNFGHTIGHAIESLCLETKQPLLHGEAVSIGMVAEAFIAKEKGLLTDDEVRSIKEKLHQAGLPISIQNVDEDALVSKMRSDKKNTFQKINFTLLDGIGNALYNQTSSDETITQAIKSINK